MPKAILTPSRRLFALAVLTSTCIVDASRGVDASDEVTTQDLAKDIDGLLSSDSVLSECSASAGDVRRTLRTTHVRNPRVGDRLSRLGYCLYQTQHHQEALISYVLAAQILESAPASSRGELAQTHHNIGVQLAILDRPDEAIQPLTEALQLKLSSPSTLATSAAYTRLELAQVLLDTEQPEAAVEVLEPAEPAFRQSPDSQDMLERTYRTLGYAEFLRGGRAAWERALAWEDKHEQLLLTSTPPRPEDTCERWILVAYWHTRDIPRAPSQLDVEHLQALDSALTALHRAERVRREYEIMDEELHSRIAERTADVFEQRGEPTKAAHALIQLSHDPMVSSQKRLRLYKEIRSYFLEAGDEDSATEYAFLYVDLAAPTSSDEESVEMLYARAVAYAEIDLPDAGAQVLRAAIKEEQQSPFVVTERVIQLNQALIDYYESQGDDESTLKRAQMQRLYLLLSDQNTSSSRAATWSEQAHSQHDIGANSAALFSVGRALWLKRRAGAAPEEFIEDMALHAELLAESGNSWRAARVKGEVVRLHELAVDPYGADAEWARVIWADELTDTRRAAEALDILTGVVERVEGREHFTEQLLLASALEAMGDAYRELECLDEAMRHLDRAHSLLLEFADGDEESILLGSVKTTVCRAARELGNAELAIDACRQALRLFDLSGVSTSRYALPALFHLANLLETRDPERRLLIQRIRAMRLAQPSQRTYDLKLANALSEHGLLLLARNEYLHAQRLFEMALSKVSSASMRSLSESFVPTAQLNLSAALIKRGEYEQARSTLLVAKDAAQKFPELVAPIYVQSGLVALELETPEGAQRLLMEGLRISQRRLAPSGEIAELQRAAYNGLAIAALLRGDPGQAMQYVRAGLAVWPTSPGSDSHRALERTLVRSRAYVDVSAEGVHHWEQLKGELELSGEAQSLKMADLHELRARMYVASGDIQDGIDAYSRALELYGVLLPPSHHITALTRVQRGVLRVYVGDEEGGHQDVTAAEPLVRAWLNQRGDASTGEERRHAIRRWRWVLDALLWVTRDGGSTPDVYRQLMSWKAEALNARMTLGLGAEAEARLQTDLRFELMLKQQRRSGLQLKTSPAESDRIELRKLDDEVARLDRQLNALANNHARLMGASSPDVVCSALQPGEALVDFTLWSLPRVVHEGAEQAQLSAFILVGGRCSAPARVELGAAQPVLNALEEWRAMGYPRKAGGRLKALIWDPIEDALGGSEAVVIVPDGDLYGLPFAALPDGKGTYLVHRYTFSTLNHAARMVLQGAPRRGEGVDRRALMVGGVHYGAPSASPTPSQVSQCLEPGFDDLPGTLDEVESIGQTLVGSGAVSEVTLLTGADPTEKLLTELSGGHHIIHVATHGFQVSDACLANQDTQIEDDTPLWGPSLPVQRSPLSLSGLALAGANAAPSRRWDNLWTAAEIAQLDLHEAELVVLSACASGLGQGESGEGVLGLSHAFLAAGAGALLVSVDEVNDAASAAFMRDFHERHSTEGAQIDAPAALREVQLQAIAARVVSSDMEWAKWVVTGPL